MANQTLYQATLIDGQPAIVGFNEMYTLPELTMEEATELAKIKNGKLKKELVELLHNLNKILVDLAYDAGMPYGLDIRNTRLEEVEDDIEEAQHILDRAKKNLELYLKVFDRDFIFCGGGSDDS